jgi:CDP-diacylglycerol--serine O-phosphatidyltransferase
MVALPRTALTQPGLLFQRFEHNVAAAIPLHPHLLSGLKLLLIWPLAQLLDAPAGVESALLLCLATFAALDYLDGVVARGRGLDCALGRILDRVTDFPIVLLCSSACHERLPFTPLAAKLLLDVLLLFLFAAGRGSTHSRLRTVVSYVSLLALLALSQGWASGLITPELTSALLWINAGISCLIVLRRVGILSRRKVADALSLSNLVCGLFSMQFAAQHQLPASLALLALGALFDGLDGAAARRWGGSRFGVYMDDLADAVSYGLAPGFALYVSLGGMAGALTGALFAGFVLTRLTFFTLDKAAADPAFFRGVPSTMGGVVAIAALIVFAQQALLIGLCVGLACALMVSFDTMHRHLGRALVAPNVRAGLAALGLLVLLTGWLGGLRAGGLLVLIAALGYGLWPSARALLTLIDARRRAGPGR